MSDRQPEKPQEPPEPQTERDFWWRHDPDLVEREPSTADASGAADGEAPVTHSAFLNLVGEVTTLAWNLVLPIVGGALLGRYLDDRLGEDVKWTLGLLALGVFAALNNLYRLYAEHGAERSGAAREARRAARKAARQARKEPRRRGTGHSGGAHA